MGNITKQYCVFDVETPNRSNNRISSISILVLRDGETIAAKDYLVNPEAPFDELNVRLTGISEKMVADAPTFPQVWSEISDFFYTSIVVAHNASFDLSVLRKCLDAYDLPAHDIWYICTLKCSQRVLSDLPNHKLPTICKHFGIALEHHRAKSDTNSCAEILKRLLQMNPEAVNRSLTGYDLSKVASVSSVRRTGNHSSVSPISQSLSSLRLLIEDILDDNQITSDEVSALNEWVQENRQLEGNYPYNKILGTLEKILADGVLEQSELDELMQTLKLVLDPVGESEQHSGDPIDIEGSLIVLTGTFCRGSRSSLEKELADRGATIQKNTTRKTNYVVVGGQGSDSWVTKNYGTKVKKALELNESGLSISIIKEDEFFERICLDQDSSQQTTIEIVETPVSVEEHIYQQLLPAFMTELDAAGISENHIKLEKKIGHRSVTLCGNQFVCRIKASKKFGATLTFRRSRAEKAAQARLFDGVIVNTPKADADIGMCRILVPNCQVTTQIAALLASVMSSCIDSVSKQFDCCSRFEECSDAKRCIHPDPDFAIGCGYRQVLRKGIVFYGKNRNVE